MLNARRKISLPVELIERILCYLDAPDILACQQICHTFCDLVWCSVCVRYNIEKYIARVQGGFGRTSTTAERLEALRSWRSGWRTAKWTTTHAVSSNNIDSSSIRFSSDILYSSTRDGKGMVFTQIPSLSRRIKDKTWTVNDRTCDSDLQGMRTYYNGVQDLLVVYDVPERCTIRMQLLASDGKQHRSAHQPVIIVPTRMVLPVGELSVTASSTLLVLRVLSGDRRHLWVWNWCTAQVLLDTTLSFPQWFPLVAISSIGFLSDTHLMISVFEQPANQAHLVILACHTLPRGFTAFSSPTDLYAHAALILELPPLLPGVRWRGLFATVSGHAHPCTQPFSSSMPRLNPFTNNKRDSDALFHGISSSRALFIHATVEGGDGTESSHVIIAPVAPIYILLELRALNVPASGAVRCHKWDDWAHGTRSIPPEIFEGGLDMGMQRLVAKRKREDGEEVILLLEFLSKHELALLKHDVSTSNEETPLTTQQLVTNPTYVDTRYFDTTVPTCAPYLEIETDIVVPRGYRAFIGEHSIVLVSDDQGEKIYYYSV